MKWRKRRRDAVNSVTTETQFIEKFVHVANGHNVFRHLIAVSM